MNDEILAARATDPESSAWVSANAGAGKTHLLTNRVTRLLYAGTDPSRILCLTYTKAAAAEMAKRLFERLGKWSLLPDGKLSEALVEIGAGVPDANDLKRARTLFAEALETPGGLKIQTIHSFCQHVLTRFPLEAGVPPRFAVLEDRSAAELMERARNAVLERAAGGEERLAKAVAVLATRAADGRFGEILEFAVATRGKLRGIVEKSGGELRYFAHLRAALALEPDDDEAGIVARFCGELRAERAEMERIAEWLLSGTTTDQGHSIKFSLPLGKSTRLSPTMM